jgi:hypothetical protein
MPKSQETKPIPIVYGFSKLSGTTVFKGNMALGVIDDKRQVVAMSNWLAICMGTIKFQAFFSPKQGYVEFDGVTETMDNYFAFYSNGARDHTTYPDDLWKQNPGSVLEELDYVNGLPGVAWAYLKSRGHPDDPGSWKMHFERDALGSEGMTSTITDKMAFYVRRDLSSSPIQPSSVGSGAETPDGSYGDNPATVIYDLLTDKLYGLGMNTEDIDTDSFTDAAAFFNSNNYGINLVIDQWQQAQAVIDKISKMVGALLTYSINGKLKLMALNSTTNLTPVVSISDDDMEDFQLTMQSWDETYNQFSAKYIQPESNFSVPQISFTERSLIAFNTANEFFTGGVRKLDFDLSYFYDVEVSSKRLHEIMKEHSLPRATIKCSVGEKYFQYICGDLITIVNIEHGVNASFRLKHKSIDGIDTNKLNFTLEQVSDAVNDPNYLVGGDSLGGTPVVDLSSSEKLYFAKFESTSEVSTNTYSDNAIIRVLLQRGDGIIDALTTQYEDPTDYTCYILGGNGVTIQVRLSSVPGADWGSIIASNSQGSLHVIVYER